MQDFHCKADIWDAEILVFTRLYTVHFKLGGTKYTQCT